MSNDSISIVAADGTIGHAAGETSIIFSAFPSSCGIECYLRGRIVGVTAVTRLDT